MNRYDIDKLSIFIIQNYSVYRKKGSNKKLRNILEGLITIMVSPREDSGEISPSRIKNHIQFLKDNEMIKENGAILVTGSIGECAVLTIEERM